MSDLFLLFPITYIDHKAAVYGMLYTNESIVAKMVVMKEGVKEPSLKRSRQHDLPTPESPIRSSLI